MRQVNFAEECIPLERSSIGAVRKTRLRAESRPAPYKCSYLPPHLHPARCGIPGKLYNRYDMVTPICDSIRRLYDSSYGNDMFEEKSDPPPELPLFHPSIQDHPDPSAYFAGTVNVFNRTEEEQRSEDSVAVEATCELCGCNEAEGRWMMTSDKDGFVCHCGNVVQRQNTVSMHRDKNCMESEDSTTRAEAVYQPRISWLERDTPSAEETRKEREREHRGSFIPERMAKKLGLGYAQQSTVRKATAEALQDGSTTDSNPFGWDKKELSKSDSLLRSLQSLFDVHKPVDRNIQFYMRKRTLWMWSRVVAHERACTSACRGSSCRLKLSKRTMGSVAESAFDYHLDQLINHGSSLNTVDHEAVRDLKERVAVSRRSVMTAHKISTRSMISLLMENDSALEPCEVEAASDSAPSEVSAPTSPSVTKQPAVMPHGGLDRVDSGLTPLEENPRLEFAQSILRVHRLLNSKVSNAVRDKAVSVLGDNFVERAKGEVAMKRGEEGKLALALILAVDDARPRASRERARGDVSSARSILNIDEKELKKLVKTISALLPSSLWSQNASVFEEESDGLF